MWKHRGNYLINKFINGFCNNYNLMAQEEIMSKEGEEKKRGRGFAGMDPEKQREIAKKGGEHSHGGGRPKESEEEQE